MPGLTTLKAVKKVLMQGVFVAALTALIAFQATGAAAQGQGQAEGQGQPLWTIVIHFEYENGFEFDYPLAHGVSTVDLGDALAECGSSHWMPSVVWYHCYPVPE